MPNKYCNLDGTKKIKDEYSKINDGFAAVELDINELGGRVDEIITTPIDGYATAQELIDARASFDTLGKRLDSSDLNKADISYVDNLVNGVVNGAPKGVFDTLVDLELAFPTGDDSIYIVSADGHWYYWDGSAWTDGGVYLANQSIEDLIQTNSGYLQRLDNDSVVAGRYYNGVSPGSTVSGDSSYGTILVTVEPETTYILFGVSRDFTFTYDGVSLVAIKDLPSYTTYSNAPYTGLSSDTVRKITTPVGCTSLYVSVRLGLESVMLLPAMLFKTSDFLHPVVSVDYGTFYDKSSYINSSKITDDSSWDRENVANVLSDIKSNMRIGHRQLLDQDSITNGKYYNGSSVGSTSNNATYGVIQIEVKPETDYVIFGCSTDFTYVWDESVLTLVKNLPSYQTYSNVNYSNYSGDTARKFTTPANCTLLFVSTRVDTPTVPPAMLFETNKTLHPDGFCKYGDYFNPSFTKVNEIHVKLDGTMDYTSFVTAIQSITDSRKDNIYNVYVYDNHDIISELGGQTFIESLTSSSDRVGLFIPRHVNVYGVNGVKTLSGKILNTWAADYYAIRAISTIEVARGDNKFKDIRITAQNMRYAVHDESGGSVPDNNVEWEDCELIHYGNDDFSGDPVGQWLSSSAYGSGMSSGSKRKFNNVRMESESYYPFSCHDNANFVKGVKLEFNGGCELVNNGGNPTYGASLKLSSYGVGNTPNVCILSDTLLQSAYIKYETVGDLINRWRLVGGNSPTPLSEAFVAAPITINF